MFYAVSITLTASDQYTTKSVILENGGVELLVQLITDPDPLVQQNTLETIELLAVDSQCRIALNEANVRILTNNDKFYQFLNFTHIIFPAE